MAAGETGETSLRNKILPVSRDPVNPARQSGRIINRLRELVIRAHRETTPEALGGADCQRMEDRVTGGRIIRESDRIAELVSVAWTECAGRSLIGKSEHIKPRPFRSKISGLN